MKRKRAAVNILKQRFPLGGGGGGAGRLKNVEKRCLIGSRYSFLEVKVHEMARGAVRYFETKDQIDP